MPANPTGLQLRGEIFLLTFPFIEQLTAVLDPSLFRFVPIPNLGLPEFVSEWNGTIGSRPLERVTKVCEEFSRNVEKDIGS